MGVRKAEGKSERQKQIEEYAGIAGIDGRHPLKLKVPFAYVEYQARTRADGKPVFFNFRLAKEMGLIPADHPHRINKRLEKVLKETFGIIIVNEYDHLHGPPVAKKDLRPNRYMATRYLQLQHPDKRGLTSGDGRSIWNGTFSAKGKVWDITSCGTGATCLSPARAKHKKFFRSGDPTVSYGCGYAQVDEGLTQALFSEILHANGIPTERVLAVIEFPNGFSVNVRAGTNLLRPSHFFSHLKQGHWLRLKAMVELFMERELANKDWRPHSGAGDRYDRMLEHLCDTFATMAARFENEYIFCWLDWDGDNILANGGIIDYGSVRQFGLFHKDYRFDDQDRYSTNIIEQKRKARYIVQTFAQMMDFVRTGKKKPIQRFRNHGILKRFDRTFERRLHGFFLGRLGFQEVDAAFLMENRFGAVKALFRDFRYFESVSSGRGLQRLPDGIMRDAIFCMRDVMRELPERFALSDEALSDREFIGIARSNYATLADLRRSAGRSRRIRSLQESYRAVCRMAATRRGAEVRTLYRQLARRAAIVNRRERVTGDTILALTGSLLRVRRKFDNERFHRLIYELIDCQVLDPDRIAEPYQTLRRISGDNARILRRHMRLISEAREGI